MLRTLLSFVKLFDFSLSCVRAARLAFDVHVVLLRYSAEHIYAAMLEVYIMWTNNELKCGNKNFLARAVCRSRLLTSVIPHWTICKHTYICIYDVIHWSNIVYLQHGGGNYWSQNDVTVTFIQLTYIWWMTVYHSLNCLSSQLFTGPFTFAWLGL